MKIKRNGQYLNENYVILNSEYDESSRSQVYEVLSTDGMTIHIVDANDNIVYYDTSFADMCWR